MLSEIRKFIVFKKTESHLFLEKNLIVML